MFDERSRSEGCCTPYACLKCGLGNVFSGCSCAHCTGHERFDFDRRFTLPTVFRGIAIFAVAGMLFAAPPAAKAAAASEASVKTQQLWSKLLTRCGGDYYYAGSAFDSAGMLNDVQMSHQGVVQYRNVRFNSVPIPISAAERANGVTSRTRITMIAQLYREGGESWSNGPALRSRNMDDIIGRALGSVNADLFDMGSNGAIALELVKFKGLWAVARSSVDSTSHLALGAKFYAVDQLIAAPTRRYDCAAGSAVPAAKVAASN